MILITRPEQQGRAWAKTLEEQGFETLLFPVLQIVPEEFEMPDLAGFQALVFTSGRAAEVWMQKSAKRDIPAYAVGQKTAEILTKNGFQTVHSADGDAQDLIRLLGRNLSAENGPVLHLRGREVAASIRKSMDIPAEEIIVYRTHSAASIPEDVLHALTGGRVRAVTLFSPRTARIFMDLIEAEDMLEAIADTKALCISQSVIECVQTQSWQDMYVCEAPNEEAMTELVRGVCTS